MAITQKSLQLPFSIVGPLILAVLTVIGCSPACDRELDNASVEASKDLLGIWKVYNVDSKANKNYEQSLLEFTQNTRGKLAAFCVDLRPSSLVWLDSRGVSYQDGQLTFILLNWGDSKTVFKGKLSRDKNSIHESSNDRYRLMLVRVDRPETVSFMGQYKALLKSGQKPFYQYEVPTETNDGWSGASLSDCGMSERKVSELVTRILQGKYKDIHDLLIVKNGKLVLEEYFRMKGRLHGPFITETYRKKYHLWASATKSVTSLLIGIAIDKGLIKSVEVPVFDFFPEYGDLNSPEKKKIQLKHLLTMTAGLEWDQISEAPHDVHGMWSTDDVIRYYLEKPVTSEPGAVYNYSNGISTVLGAIVKNVSGIDASDFSGKYLFNPLGITDFNWQYYPDGSVDTDGGVEMRPRDMAKIGQLILNQGSWSFRRIVSDVWIDESTTGRVKLTDTMWYGYQWRKKKFYTCGKNLDAVFSFGWGGQYVFVFPDIDMVVVSNACNFEYKSERFLHEMLEKYILPAALQDKE